MKGSWVVFYPWWIFFGGQNESNPVSMTPDEEILVVLLFTIAVAIWVAVIVYMIVCIVRR